MYKTRKNERLIIFVVAFATLFLSLLMGVGRVFFANSEGVVPQIHEIRSFSGEASFSVYIGADDNLYTAGSNSQGQLGRGYKSDTVLYEPLRAKVLDGVKLVDTGRAGFVLALKNNGSLYGFGQNQFAQLGQGADVFNDDANTNCILIPSQIFLPDDPEILDVKAGYRHSVVLTSDGDVFTFGSNGFGQLGLGLEMTRRTVKGTPTKIDREYFGGEKVVAIATAEFTSFALTESGLVYAWGDNDYGQIGSGDDETVDKFYSTPVKTLLTNVKKISAEGNSGMALTNDNRVFIWGSNRNGEFGNPEFLESFSSRPIEVSKVYKIDGTQVDTVFKDIACGGITNFILGENGKVYGFGAGGKGELGFLVHDKQSPFININNAVAPLEIPFFKPLNIYEITNGSDETFKGKFPVDIATPIDVKIESLIGSVSDRTFAVDEDGLVWAWGDNANGLLGSGDINTAMAPIRATLYRNDNYDKDFVTKNYKLKPLITLIVIALVCVALFVRSEIGIRKQRKTAGAAAH